MVSHRHGSHCLDRKILNSANFASFQPVGSGLFYQDLIFCLLKIVCKTKYYFDQKRVLSSAPGSRLTSTQLDRLNIDTVKLSSAGCQGDQPCQSCSRINSSALPSICKKKASNYPVTGYQQAKFVVI